MAPSAKLKHSLTKAPAMLLEYEPQRQARIGEEIEMGIKNINFNYDNGIQEDDGGRLKDRDKVKDDYRHKRIVTTSLPVCFSHINTSVRGQNT